MKSYRYLLLAAALAAAAATAISPLKAQTGESTPIIVKQSAPKTPKAVWLNAEVVRADRVSIVVRERNNLVAIHTFTYGDQLKPKMEAVANEGGFQSGDRVKILYQPGQSVALKVHGKPSK
jgi:hypothetical protein